ncbi:MAG: hypothetical protein WD397_14050 [Wenzhouxiangellaceae bacterium]
MKTDDKLELLNYLIFIRGKLQRLSIELLSQGEDTSRVDAAEKKLAAQINKLRANLMQRWQGNAKDVLAELRDLNEKAQDKVRQMRDATNKAEKASEVVGILDKGLDLVSGILA